MISSGVRVHISLQSYGNNNLHMQVLYTLIIRTCIWIIVWKCSHRIRFRIHFIA